MFTVKFQRSETLKRKQCLLQRALAGGLGLLLLSIIAVLLAQHLPSRVAARERATGFANQRGQVRVEEKGRGPSLGFQLREASGHGRSLLQAGPADILFAPSASPTRTYTFTFINDTSQETYQIAAIVNCEWVVKTSLSFDPYGKTEMNGWWKVGPGQRQPITYDVPIAGSVWLAIQRHDGSYFAPLDSPQIEISWDQFKCGNPNLYETCSIDTSRHAELKRKMGGKLIELKSKYLYDGLRNRKNVPTFIDTKSIVSYRIHD